MHASYKSAGLLLGAGLLIIPTLSQAAGLTSAQISSIISLLQSFGAPASTITEVQAVLNGTPLSHEGEDNASSTPGLSASAQGSTTAPGQEGKQMCITLNRDLGPGSQGNDVRDLQDVLAQDPTSGFTGTSTGFFGPMTQHALKHFQEDNDIASSSTGTVGPLTRGFFERRCGRGLDHGHGDH